MKKGEKKVLAAIDKGSGKLVESGMKFCEKLKASLTFSEAIDVLDRALEAGEGFGSEGKEGKESKK